MNFHVFELQIGINEFDHCNDHCLSRSKKGLKNSSLSLKNSLVYKVSVCTVCINYMRFEKS